MTALNAERCRIKILMVGPMPPPFGGIGVSFKLLVDMLRQRDDVEIAIVDFNEIREQNGRSLHGLLRFCRTVVEKARCMDVITVYFASTALPSVGFLLLVLARLLGKPLVVRKAAGFDYLDLGPLRGRIAHFVTRHADLYLAETKHLVDLAHQRGISHVRWYPTARPMGRDELTSSDRNDLCRKFVFIGQVREYKGIREIIQAAERFEESISVDIYGPLFDDLPLDIFKGCKRVRYCGSLTPENVIPTMKQYDMFLLPTKAVTEGYPGAVFESYAAGLPVITTRCGGIPEIVDRSCGLFVEPGNADSLYEAMNIVIENSEVYRGLKQGVVDRRKEFDAGIWTDRFVEYCYEVFLKGGLRDAEKREFF